MQHRLSCPTACGSLVPTLGIELTSPVLEGKFLTSGCCCEVASVLSNSVQPQRWQPTRLPRPWDAPGKSTGVGCYFLLQCMKVKRESEVAQSCPTLCDPMDCSLQGSSVHGIFQARVLEHCRLHLTSGPPGKYLCTILKPSIHLPSQLLLLSPIHTLCLGPCNSRSQNSCLMLCSKSRRIPSYCPSPILSIPPPVKSQNFRARRDFRSTPSTL